MKASENTARTVQASQLQDLISHLVRGREWATPGIESALRKALAGIDTGLEVASPRIQAGLRSLADELAEGVEVLTPRFHDRITRIIPGVNAVPDRRVELPQSPRPSRKRWWIAGLMVAGVLGGAALWRVLRPAGEPPVGHPLEQAPESGEAPGNPAA